MTPLSTTISQKRVLLVKPIEGSKPDRSHFRTVSVTEPVPELVDNAVLVKNLIFSLDPYVKPADYTAIDGSPVVGFGIATVVKSKNDEFPVGAILFGPLHWEEYTVLDQMALAEGFRLDQALDRDVPLSVYNGILGLTGLTVWDSLNFVGNLKAGETIYISSAAGTLGQLAGQLAKRKGLRVIGSAGSDEKVAFLKSELGFDGAFNYKTQDKRQALTELVGEKGLDIYYDLVMDDTLDVALELLNAHGRIIGIGALSVHQGQAPYAPKNLMALIEKSLRYEGYMVYERFDQLEAFWKELTPLVKSGEIKSGETLVQGSIEDLTETYLKFLNGGYTGKVNIEVAKN
ncbi:hypothetical protein BGW38_010577 [Lunasporangiospora selenospora]|uniref:Enoyl reductase (ER) domain-containing protein n=1 Tax=Lunasporangiospora selenospora TaxID=979761 RepID=A0A9P6FY91_9FUNG|nr:hypothetical protein BGW38_010577 [Lunasporangiospora selenospora]